jgi:hypothetical protein
VGHAAPTPNPPTACLPSLTRALPPKPPKPPTDRYFGATGYLYSLWRPEDASWLSAFASLGDTLSAARTPAGLAPRGGRAARPRLAAVRLPGSGGAASAAAGNSSSTGGGGGGGGGNDAFDSFFVVLMGASPASVRAARRAVASALAASGSPASGAPLAAAINELPIPGPLFGETLGLAPESSYLMLLLRSIVGGAGPGALAQFKAFAAAGPLRAWRLTPRSGGSGSVATSGGGGGGGGSGGGGESYPLPDVVPRVPPGAAAGGRGNGSGAGGGAGFAFAPEPMLAAAAGGAAAPPLGLRAARPSAAAGAGAEPAPQAPASGGIAQAVGKAAARLLSQAAAALPWGALWGPRRPLAVFPEPPGAPPPAVAPSGRRLAAEGGGSAAGSGGGGNITAGDADAQDEPGVLEAAGAADAGQAEALRREVEAQLAGGGLRSEALLQPGVAPPSSGGQACPKGGLWGCDTRQDPSCPGLNLAPPTTPARPSPPPRRQPSTS